MNRMAKDTGTKVLLYGKNLTDLTISLADEDKFISLSAGLNYAPNETGWWKRGTSDFVWMRDFLQQKYRIDNLDFDYGNGWSIAEGNLILNIKNKKLKMGDTLYARVMESSRGGTVEFWQGDNKIGELDTKVEKPDMVTIKLTGSKKVPDRFYKY